MSFQHPAQVILIGAHLDPMRSLRLRLMVRHAFPRTQTVPESPPDQREPDRSACHVEYILTLTRAGDRRHPPGVSASDGDCKQARITVPTLTDGVVRVDGFTLEDVEAHLAGEDEQTARRSGWWPKRSTPETVANAIRRWNDAWATSGPTRAFAVRDAATGQLVGHCELRHQEAGIAHVSYSTGWANRGRGYASRALRLLSAWAFREADVERLELYVEPDNTASRGVARRAGFQQEGLLRMQGRGSTGRHDMILYARLPADP